ncbi:MAG: sulfotransferase [Flavobacteriales bacterium]|nr:sulfotransferase [Flavobacteriales bacterium]MCB9191221.1 sulfotransferase [Flavobacteriales bacterium]MCB9204207.1 sulfotransferase [Flavobacteriales bacterium]
MRILNALIGLLQPLGITPSAIDPDAIEKKAKRVTGLTDLGNGMHRVGMEALRSSVDNEPMTDFGILSSTGFGVVGLTNRLRMIDHFKKHPEIADVKIEKPVFIVGFPRTGTTLLQNLLHLSEDRRALQFWELTNPIPVSDDPEKDIRRRHRKTKFHLAVANFVVPEMKFIHEVRHDSLEECWSLFIPQFSVQNWEMTNKWPEYGKFMAKHDMRPVYEEYKKYLQVIVDRVPDKKLILKCPDHLWHLDALLDVFPDACIVWTHRDPGRSIPSYCSLASLNWRLLYGEFNPKELGPYIEERFITGIERGIKVREQVGEERFLDVNFKTLLEDPIAAVNRITEYFDLTPINEAKMQAYLDRDRPDNRGKHKYSDGHYGLDSDEIRQRYKDYIARFGISVN